MSKTGDRIKTAIRNFLEIKEPQSVSVNITQLGDHEAEVFKNTLWYRGRANELEEFYKKTPDGLGNTHFWGSSPTKGMNIRKVHTGLPKLIVNTLTSVSTNDLNSVELSSRQEEWDEIAKDNDFKKLISKAIKNMLAKGDCVLKLSFDPDVSKSPIIEVFPAERTDIIYERGRITGITFKTKKHYGDRDFTLKELYTKNSITYTLEDKEGKEVDISSFDELEKYHNIVNHSDFIPAVLLMMNESEIYKGRGESVFEGRHDNFDAFDEVWSQWMLAVRKGQIKEFIPENLIPKNPNNGAIMSFNEFDNNFIVTQTDMREGAQNKIETTQGQIQHEALLSTYCTALDLCLQGLISPSTLGIDVKKLDNAEAQREKEKTTLYMRDKILEVLEPAITELVEKCLEFKDAVNKTGGELPEVTVNFGGYANPSFEAQVETVGKASQYGIMSVETSVDELYGDTKDDDWKKDEVRRIKEERGITEMAEPALNDYDE